MSGHSHWAGIKHKKGLADAQRSKTFSKLASEITIAVKNGDKDPNSNPRLRTAIEKAKELNMPAQNIERAVKKGTGEEAGNILEEIFFEGYGPGNIAVLITGITDNKNRTSGELKQIFDRVGGKLVQEGAIRWMFEKKGIILVSPGILSKEDAELLCIEAGAQDLSWTDEKLLEIQTSSTDLELVKNALGEKGVTVQSFSLGWVAKETISLGEKEGTQVEQFFETLDENDSVQEIFSNLG